MDASNKCEREHPLFDTIYLVPRTHTHPYKPLKFSQLQPTQYEISKSMWILILPTITKLSIEKYGCIQSARSMAVVSCLAYLIVNTIHANTWWKEYALFATP